MSFNNTLSPPKNNRDAEKEVKIDNISPRSQAIMLGQFIITKKPKLHSKFDNARKTMVGKAQQCNLDDSHRQTTESAPH